MQYSPPGGLTHTFIPRICQAQGQAKKRERRMGQLQGSNHFIPYLGRAKATWRHQCPNEVVREYVCLYGLNLYFTFQDSTGYCETVHTQTSAHLPNLPPFHPFTQSPYSTLTISPATELGVALSPSSSLCHPLFLPPGPSWTSVTCGSLPTCLCSLIS